MPQSPSVGSDGPVRVTVISNGTAVTDTLEIVEVTVQRAVNTIPSARLVLRDGDVAQGDFPASDAATFAPGAEIEIKAGYGDTEASIYKGLVVRHGIRISGENDTRLVVECRDKAAGLTIGRRHATYIDKKDSDIITSLLSDGGLTATVDATTVQFKELVQHGCTDWDFVVARAEVNGMLVIVADGAATVQAPKTDASPVLSVSYGVDLFSFQGDIDARTQLASVTAVAWDPKNQAVVTGSSAAPPTLNSQGDLASATLAGVVGPADFRLRSSVPLDAAALTEWAKAQQVKSGLSRVRGRMGFQGSAQAAVGSLISVAGVGNRFNGDAFVTAVRHEIADGNWVTEAEFGLSADWFVERPDVSVPPAGGWLPAVSGLQTGVVLKLDGDPEGENRIQVSTPVAGAAVDTVWARLLQFYASSGFGAFFVPEVGDEVVLGYFNDDPGNPVILGSLYSSSRAPSQTITAQNDIKTVVTRSMTAIEFDDGKKIITVRTPAGNRIVLSDDGKSILLQDQNGNKVQLGQGGITLDSPKDIKLTAKGGITLDAVNAIGVTSKADVKSSGLNVACEAQVGFTAKGNASAELSASGQTTVKGAMVMIN